MSAARTLVLGLLVGVSVLSAQRLRIETGPRLPDATVGIDYSVTIEASGGRQPYVWAIVGGDNVPGLRLNTLSGVLSGRPTQEGDYRFRIGVLSGNGDTESRDFRLQVNAAATVPPSITTSGLPDGQVGSTYSATLAATGGTPPYTWSLASGSLPAGLSINGSTISGTPSTAGTSTFTVRVTDSANQTGTRGLQIVIRPGPPTITTTALPAGQAGSAYSATLTASGGTPPYTWSLASGSLPAGLSISGSTITGTPTTAGTSSFTIRVTDSASQTATRALQIVINAPPPAITTTTFPAGQVGSAYSATLAASGGTPPYTWSLAGGSLPPGLNLTGNAIAGTPSSAGTYNFTVRVTDSASQTATRALQIVINAGPPTITTTSLPGGQVGTAYSAPLAASGGTPPYTWALVGGSLPPGLNLSGAAITGTPSATGPFSFTVRVTDGASQSATQALQIVIAAGAPVVSTTSLPGGQVGAAYSQSLSAAGGTPPYTWALASGSLPAGLSLNGSTISGTPSTPGTSSFAIRVTDSASQSATQALQIVITAGAPSITTTALPAAQVSTAYSQTLSATGGTPPYSWALAGGSLPPGLTLIGATISGTPTAAGGFNFSVRVSDAASQSATAQLQIAVSGPAATPIAISTQTLGPGTVGAPYAQVLSATGGQPPYVWSVAAGALPAGLTLSPAGQISGTPSAAGSFPLTVRVTDSASKTADQSLTLVIGSALAIAGCPTDTASVGVPFTTPLTANGGTPPYLWSLASGQLPTGLTLGTTNGQLTGTPVAPGNFAFVLQVADSGGTTATRPCTMITSAALVIRTETVPDATTRASYTYSLTGSGGTPPYRWTITSGSLPPGLALNEGAGSISGLPTTPGRFAFTMRLSDVAGSSTERAFAMEVAAELTIPSCPGATGVIGQAYTSTVTAIGGQSPYTWSVVSGGLPDGLVLGAATGSITGTPTTAATSQFTLRAADASGSAATRACSIRVAPRLTLTSTTLPTASAGAAYEQTLSATGGTPPYVWTVSAGSLPPGLALNAGSGQISGVPGATGTFNFTVRLLDAAGAAAEAPFGITVNAGFVVSSCPSPVGSAGSPYSSAVSAAGGQAPIRWDLASGALPDGLVLASGSGTVSGMPALSGTSDFVVRATDASNATATRSCSITIEAQGIAIEGPTILTDAILGVDYAEPLSVTGGRRPYLWALAEGALPEGIALTAAGQLQGQAKAAGVFKFTARVSDADGRAAVRAFTLRVLPAAAPTLSFGDVPEIVAPAQQPRIVPGIAAAYPVPLTITLSLSFTPDPGLVDDKSIQFVTGGRTVELQVPANTVDVVMPAPQLAFQTGTVAGTIDLSARIMAGDLDITPSPAPVKRIRIDRTAPVISSARATPTANGFELVISGFATTREVESATFTFTAATGSRFDSNEVIVPTADAAKTWFTNAASFDYGGQFSFVQPFTLSGASVSEVTVTLTNAQGTSQPVRVRF